MRNFLKIIASCLVLSAVSCIKIDDKDVKGSQSLAGHWLAVRGTLPDGTRMNFTKDNTFLLSVNTAVVKMYDLSLTLPDECQAIENVYSTKGKTIKVTPTTVGCDSSNATYNVSKNTLTLTNAHLSDKLIFKRIELGRISNGDANMVWLNLKVTLDARAAESTEKDKKDELEKLPDLQLKASDLDGFWQLISYKAHDKTYVYLLEGDSPPDYSPVFEQVVFHFKNGTVHQFMGVRAKHTKYMPFTIDKNILRVDSVYEAETNTRYLGFSLEFINYSPLLVSAGFIETKPVVLSSYYVQQETYSRVTPENAATILKDHPDYKTIFK